jgi:hypothetical protein
MRGRFLARGRVIWEWAGLGADSGHGVGGRTGTGNGGRPVELKRRLGSPERQFGGLPTLKPAMSRWGVGDESVTDPIPRKGYLQVGGSGGGVIGGMRVRSSL